MEDKLVIGCSKRATGFQVLRVPLYWRAMNMGLS